MDAAPSLYRGHRFPVEIINHCVWLYYRFPLSLRDIEEMMAQRGVIVSYETIHQWCHKFGQTYANGLRRRRARPGDKWHIDDVFIKIAGKTHYLWRAVVPQAAQRRTLRTEGIGHRQAGQLWRGASAADAGVEHRQSKYLNNRAENSHQPTRARERAARKFRSPGGAQRFLSVFSGISPHFRPHRHLLSAAEYRREMGIRFSIWNQVVGLPAA